jgi:hypothetical protein
MKYLNCYAVSRHYGGPEEGGWWYDSGEPLASVPVPETASEEEIETTRSTLKEMFSHFSDDPDRYSVNGGEDIEVYVEDHFAESFPNGRQTYE